MNGLIKISVLDIDNDEFQFQVEIENSSCKTSIDFYGYADIFKDLGQKLSDFPANINEIVLFQLGEDDRNGLTL